MPSRYINPYTDFGFKKLFGEEANKDLLIDFLNAVLPSANKVADLTFRNSEQLPDNFTDRKAIFDIACIGERGELFTVEMQKAKQHYFKDRALFYASYPIQRQAQKGDWDFKLNPVFLVAVLDFEYDEHEERRKIYRLVTLKDQDGDTFSGALNFVFLQMPLFQLDEVNLITRQDKWMYFLQHLEDFEEIPNILREPVFEKAFAAAEYVNFPHTLQEKYQGELKIYRDNYAVMKTAVDEGRSEGFAEGMERGKNEGKIEGKIEEKFETVRNMKAESLPSALIAKITGLSVGEIEKMN